MSVVRGEAERFAIWRMGNTHNWECTYDDVAEATEIPVTQVIHICLVNEWHFCDDPILSLDLLIAN